MILIPLLIAALRADAAPADSVYRGRDKAIAVQIPRVEADILVDGNLTEPVWSRAAVLTGFSQYSPSDGIAAADSTRVLVWYSSTAIHFGIRAYQPASTVRANLADRDKISQDDNVQLLLSTFNDGRQAAVFAVNPLGIQADGMLVERGTTSSGGFAAAVAARESVDLTPDFVYQSKGHVTDWGYDVEVRIPFKSLKYQSSLVQSWGINVTRIVQYRGYENTWTPATRASASFLAQGGTLVGLTDLHRGLVLDVTPEATQRTDGVPGAGGATPAWRYTSRPVQLGATARWGITNNMALNGTVNPDFSQVEADANQISFDPRAQLSYAEKRPFFLDGIEQFATTNSLVYTRRIVQPLAAAKLTGKVAGFDIAALSAVDQAVASTTGRDHPIFNIVRLQKDIGSGSRIGMLVTDREDGANSNRVAEIDSRLVWKKAYSLALQVGASQTRRGGRDYGAPIWDVRFNRNGKYFGWRTLFSGVSDDFRTESGFLSRIGQVHANFSPNVTWYGQPGGTFENVNLSMLFDDIWNYKNWQRRGDARDKKLHWDLTSQVRGGWNIGAALYLETFGYDPAFYGPQFRIEVPKANGAPSDTLPFTGTPRLFNRDWSLRIATPQTKYLTMSVLYIFGHDENFYEWSSSEFTVLSVSADIRASDQLRIGFTYNLSDYLRSSDGSRVGRIRDPRLKIEYQLSRNIFVRAIGEYVNNYTDNLRDDSRTNNPLLVYNSGTKKWVRATTTTTNNLRTDFLFSYKPNPGTVFYAGYGAQLAEPEAFSFRNTLRRNDALFIKASYLFRQ